MNFYVITEGKAEAIVYKSWIPYINPELSPIEYVDSVDSNNFYIVSSQGYPYIFQMIENAIKDIYQYQAFDRLV